jgi:hypothetical protein
MTTLDVKTTDEKDALMRRLLHAIGCVLVVGVLAYVGHSVAGEAPDQPVPPTTYKLQEVSFLLERGFCHGECPIYSVEVLGNGTVFYNGERHVRIEGQRSDFVTHEQVLELLSAIYDATFPDLMSGYHSKRKPEVDEDGQVSVLHVVTKGTPRTVVTLRIGEYSKQVSYQSEYAPRELINLATFIDELVDSKQWISQERKGHD